MRRSLTKAERVRRRGDIRNLFFAAKRWSVSGAGLRCVRNGLPHSRLLVSPGKRFGNAVQRNYAKRVAREIFRSLKPEIEPGYDLAIIFYSGEYTFQDRQNQITALLDRAGIRIRRNPEQGLDPAPNFES